MAREVDLHEIAQQAAELRASDIFLKVGVKPSIRVNGSIRILDEDYEIFTEDEMQGIVTKIMSPRQQEIFHREHEIDLAFQIEGLARFRANFYRQRGTTGAVLRIIPLEIYSLEQLNMPKVIAELAKLRQGLVLVTGPTGSGKSTTLAAIIDLINSTRRTNIITIEDPIEFVHPDKLSIVTQREIGIDTESFTRSLKSVVRQSPDIILIGEMRDVETMNAALASAETGHLVFSTVHTSSAAETLDRIVNLFPPEQKQLICMRIAGSLKAVISQKLVPRIDIDSRIAAVEIMISTPSVQKLLEEGRSNQIYQVITEGEYWGMQSMNQSLCRFAKAGIISKEEAIARAGNVTEMKQMLRRN